MTAHQVKKTAMVIGLLGVVVAGSLAIQSIGSKKALIPGMVLSRSEDASTSRRGEKPLPLSFDLLTNWKYIEDQTPIPDAIKAYDGKYVEITGYLLPYGGTDEEPEYMLFPNLWGCCFGQAPEINHILIVKVRGKRIEDFSAPVAVRGTFNVGEMRDDGFLICLYHIQADVVLAK
jgi:hypothetical protein